VSFFVSYARPDSDFALHLAREMKASGRNVWLDQLDISLGDRWDRAVQTALETCTCVLLILSPQSVASENVADEYNFALEEKKMIIPVLYQACSIPFRLRRFQRADFQSGFESGFEELLRALAPEPAPDPNAIRGRRWVISGQIQGLGFRSFVARHAADLGITGWVRNLSDGRIDVYASGTLTQLNAIGEKIKKGPPMAAVRDIKETIEEAEAPPDDLTGFRLR
jgi:acylphosphatase